MSIDDRPLPNKISLYTSDPLPDTIYITSEKYCSTLTSPCNSPPIHFPNSETPTTDHIMIKCGYDYEKPKRGYCARRHDGIRCYKKRVYIAPRVLFIRGFITVVDLLDEIQRGVLDFLNHLPHPRCTRCGMLVPRRALNGRHPVTDQCARGAERKRRFSRRRR